MEHMLTSTGYKSAAELAPLEAKINKMAALASKLAEVGDNIQDFPARNAARTWNAQLAHLITGYLESGRDDALNSALANLVSPTMEPTEGWTTLRDYIRTYASWELVDDSEVPHEYYLCSIPVMLGPHAPQVDGDKLAALESVLRQSGLVGVGAEVSLVPCGLVPAELVTTLSFSQVKQLTQLLAHCKRTGKWRLASDFLASRLGQIDRSVAPTNLHSMLLLYRTEDRSQPFAYGSMSAEVVETGHGSAEAIYESLCTDWRRNAEAHLADAFSLPLEQIYVGDPQPYFHGQEELDEELRKRQFLMRTGGVLGDQDETYEAVRAGILPMAFCRGFSVVYERDGARAGSVDFLSFPAESTEAVLEMLVEALATLNIEPKRVAQA
jgi:hypothetical protein